MSDLVRLLRSGGLNVRDERVDPRPGSFAPIGVVNHHTATPGPALETCKNGRRDLAGPLCNINITRQGVINVVCDGRANHAGKGSSVVAGDVRAGRPISQDARDRHLTDDTDGNTRFYGIEVDNDGVGEPLTGVQQDALIAVNAVLVEAHAWSPNACIHHRQWTARKTDMRWRGDIPALVRFYLSPHTEDELMPVAKDDNDARRAWVRRQCLDLWGREPSAVDHDFLANEVALKGADNVLAQIADHSYAQAFKAKRGW